jgi:peptide/nickel transport system substrate-binding protein
MLKRPKSQLIMLSFSLLSVLILLLSACGTPTTPAGGGGNASGTPVKGGTWIDDLYEEPDSLIPNASTETFSDMFDQSIYTPLFYGDSKGVLHPGLATEIPTLANGGVSSDLKTWTFHIRPGVKWTDGQPVDARDVDFSWRTWDNPKFGAASTVGFNLIQSTTISPDNMTITFHLSQGFEPFVSIWADGLNAPMPAHHFSSMAVDQITKSPDNLNPSVTDGPFMMKESKPGDHYTVVRNPNYYLASQGYPYLDSVVFRIVTDQNTILKDLQAGSIDSSWFLDVSKVPAYQRLTNYKLVGNPYSTNFEAMYFNFKDKILANNLDVREAMAMAIDHQALIDVARRGQATPLCTDHGSGLTPGYQPNAPCPKFDPTGALNMLKQDGWVMGPDKVLSKNGQRLEFTYSTTANNLWRADDELILQQDFAAIGIKLDVQNYPASTFFGSFLGTGDPTKDQLFEFENTFTYDADDASVAACSQWPPNGENFMFYCNKQLDALFSQEQSTADPNARQQAFDQIHQIYLTQFPFITLYAPEDIAMVKVGTNNYAPGPMGATETVNIWTWWCTGGKC